MGASGWHYYVPYQDNIQKALDELRAQVLLSGDYVGGRSKSKRKHASIDALLSARGFDGTHSILDVSFVSDQPMRVESVKPEDFYERHLRFQALLGNDPAGFIRRMAQEAALDVGGSVHPVMSESLMNICGTLTPEREAVEAAASALCASCARNTGRYVIVFRDGAPVGIFFAGASGD